MNMVAGQAAQPEGGVLVKQPPERVRPVCLGFVLCHVLGEELVGDTVRAGKPTAKARVQHPLGIVQVRRGIDVTVECPFNSGAVGKYISPSVRIRDAYRRPVGDERLRNL
jgi:hypothetical protein